MALEALEVNKDTIVTSSYLTVLANILESYNEEIQRTDITLDDKNKVLSQINEAYSLYENLKNSVLDSDISQVIELKTNTETLINDIQIKLTNGDFVGEPGTTDYNNLTNKPTSDDIKSLANVADTGWQDFTPYLINDWVAYDSYYSPKYRKIGSQFFLKGLISSGTSEYLFQLPDFLRPRTDILLSPLAIKNIDVVVIEGLDFLVIRSSGLCGSKKYSTFYTSICCTYST